MRIAAQRDVFTHLDGKRGFLALRNDSNAPRQLGVRERPHITRVERGDSARYVGAPQQRPDNRALARAVGSSESGQLPALGDECHTVDGMSLGTWVAHHQILE